MATLDLPFQSRYKDTTLLKDAEAGYYFDIITPPLDFEALLDQCTSRRIEQKHVGRLDLLANEVYGDVSLWWVIAWVNQWQNPVEDMIPGNFMWVPPHDAIVSFTLRGSLAE